jgi:hypothetical protein
MRSVPVKEFHQGRRGAELHWCRPCKLSKLTEAKAVGATKARLERKRLPIKSEIESFIVKFSDLKGRVF